MKKEAYRTPELEVVTFDTEDVITNSSIGGGGIGDGGGEDVG